MNTDIIELGLDVGSTTVKGVVLDSNHEILWKEYRRHNAHQPETVRDLLDEVTDTFPRKKLRISITGSGSRSIAPLIDATFIQEVNAVTLAVETLYPQVGSVIELGGQDAKVIIWKGEDEKKSTLTYMNDKCAGGTGSTIDKIMGKLGLSQEQAAAIEADMVQANAVDAKAWEPHKISAKCGVFAETDVVGLLKAGVSRKEIFLSLCNAIIHQNLEVLVRGNVLRDKVLLLGGPNQFIKAFAPLWREQIQKAWELHGYTPKEKNIEEAIFVPGDAQYFAAMGAVLFNRAEDKELTPSNYKPEKLIHFIEKERGESVDNSSSFGKGLAESQEEIDAFEAKHAIPSFENKAYEAGSTVDAYIGLDGGSTSTKMVMLDPTGEPIYKDYRLSSGNPVEDVAAIFKKLSNWCSESNITLNILGTGATGYAAAILKEGFNLDSSVVETVAHMKSAVKLYGEIDVICDVGGQDIKVLFMKHGQVVDFKLNTQCSAGNGYFLQGMAEQFNIKVEEYAATAFKAKRAPRFNYGCAVFMEQDRVNFQQAGWTKEEMMAGLALVLPLNIWNYVVQESNLAKLGHRFVLQGGTQKNLAAAKAQVDYINSKVPGAEVHVHKYADIGGAIGAALEVIDQGITESHFIGLDAAGAISYRSTSDETTVCSFCLNKCRRTFIDIDSGEGRQVRFISGYNCEKGAVEEASVMKEEQARLREIKKANPNIVAEAAKAVFSEFDYVPLPEAGTVIDKEQFYPVDALHHFKARERKTPFARSDKAAQEKRAAMKVAIPRLLNMYYYTPFFSTYLRALGIGDVLYSDYTSDKLWKEGNKWGAIDPCFPAKVAPAHIYNILTKKECDAILFPIITHLESTVEKTLANTACVIQMGTPEVVEAVFTRDRNLFEEKSVTFWDPAINMDRPVEFEGILFEFFEEKLGITRDENAWAVNEGRKALRKYLDDQRETFAKSINTLVDEDRVGLLLIGHPYHHDPGLNHNIPDEFQKLGYPIFTIESLPITREFLEPLFADEDVDFDLDEQFKITKIWERNFNRNTNHKVWAAMIAARHPNLAVIDLSSFKCGHDAPTYTYIDELLDVSETPHFMFHDIDQNRPGATFKIRIDTIDYFLKQEEAKLKESLA